MDEARNLLERIERIEALERRQAPAAELLDELRELVVEAEAWARAELPGARAEAAVERVRGCLDAAPREVAMT
jgi:hypothetical protein